MNLIYHTLNWILIMCLNFTWFLLLYWTAILVATHKYKTCKKTIPSHNNNDMCNKFQLFSFTCDSTLLVTLTGEMVCGWWGDCVSRLPDIQCGWQLHAHHPGGVWRGCWAVHRAGREPTWEDILLCHSLRGCGGWWTFSGQLYLQLQTNCHSVSSQH